MQQLSAELLLLIAAKYSVERKLYICFK